MRSRNRFNPCIVESLSAHHSRLLLMPAISIIIGLRGYHQPRTGMKETFLYVYYNKQAFAQ
jgi:hypothetical protein